MNIDLVIKLANLVALFGSVTVNVYLFFKTKADERFAEIEEQLAEFDRCAEQDRETVRAAITERKAVVHELAERVSVLDQHVRSLPTHNDIRMIDNRLSALEERSRNTLDGVRRIEQHLMDR